MSKVFSYTAIMISAALLVAGPVKAEVPTVKLESGVLVPPSGVFTSGAHTAGLAAWTSTPPEIKALARSLGAGRLADDPYAQNVLDYVRNNIDVEFRFGLGKGGRGALIDQSGTPFDQAELMVKLLAEAGVSATFQVGTISPSPQQFGLWTGLVKDLNEPAQTFSVDAKAACKLLADGGIPATVNGQSSCASVSGNLTSVTLAGIWVQALGKLYDPAFKSHTLYNGIDIASAAGCGSGGCGPAMVAAATGAATTGSVNGLTAISSVQEASLYQTLKGFAVNLQNTVQAADPTRRIEQVVGGRRILAGYSAQAGTNLAYTASAALTWTQIPDDFRTRLRVKTDFTGLEFFSDELAGRRLQLLTNDYAIDDRQFSLPNCRPCLSERVILEIDHPYPANGGAYGDDVATLPINVDNADPTSLPWTGVAPITIVHGLGAEGPSSEKHMAALQEANPLSYDTSWTIESKTTTKQYRADNQPIVAARFLSQGAAADVLVGGLGKAIVTRHHDIGVVFADPYSPGSMSVISVQSALSVASKEDQSMTGPVFQTSAAVLSMVEGSVNQQIVNGPAGLSTATDFWSNNLYGKPFVFVPSATLRQSSNLLFAEAGNAGYDLIAPQNRSGTAWDAAGYSSLLFTRGDASAYLVGGLFKGAGSYVRDPLRTAIDAAKISEMGAARKKYASVSPADGAFTYSQTDLVTGIGDFPESLPFIRTYRSDIALKEEVQSSIVSTETTSGAGASSITLSWVYSGPDTSAALRLGGGWTHNYNVLVSLSGNGAKSLGSERALDATSAIAAVWSILDANRAPTFAGRLSSVFATYWLAKDISFASATLDKGGKTEALQRLSNGVFLSASGDARLEQTGAPTLDLDFGAVSLKYTGRDGDTIDFTPAMRSKAPYRTGTTVQKNEPIFKADKWSFPGGVIVNFNYQRGWMLTSYPQPPVKVSCDTGGGTSAGACDGVSNETQPDAWILTGVSNNLGRSLTFGRKAVTAQTWAPDGMSAADLGSSYQLTSVTDENGRKVDYALSDCNGQRLLCDRFTVSYSDGVKTLSEQYDYKRPNDGSDPADSLYPRYRLRKWFGPANTTVAYGAVTYDALYHVASLTDRNGHTTTYYPGAAMGVERWKRAQIVSPRLDVPEVTTQIFDEKNSLLVNIDPIGRKTVNAYDNLGRLVRTERPAHDVEERRYDFRGNVVVVCQIPKERSQEACNPAQSTNETNLVSRTTYGEAANVLICADYRLCNKVASETDARGNTTNYTWNDQGALAGLIKQVLAPLPKPNDSTRPQIDLGYTGYAAPGGGTVQLLTSKTEKISGSQSVTTTYDYDATSKLEPKSMTVDSGGKALKTCYAFDPFGNLTGVTDPRATCP